MVQTTMLECILERMLQECIRGRVVDIVVEDFVEMVQIISQGCILEHIVEQSVDVPMPEILKESVEVEVEAEFRGAVECLRARMLHRRKCTMEHVRVLVGDDARSRYEKKGFGELSDKVSTKSRASWQRNFLNGCRTEAHVTCGGW